MIGVIIVSLFFVLSLLNFRSSILVFSCLTFFTSKGFAFLDIPSLPYLSVNRALILVLCAICVLRICLHKKNALEFEFKLKTAFIGISISAFLTYFFNIFSYPSDFVTSIISVLEIWLPCYLVGRYLNYNDIQKLAKYLFYISLFVSVYGIVTYFSKVNPYFDFITSTVHTDRVVATNYSDTVRGVRSTSVFSHPITYGGFLSILFFYIFYYSNYRRNKILIFFSNLIILFAMILTNSRTPLAFILFGMAIWWLFENLSTKIFIMFLSIITLSIGFFFFQEQFFSVFDSLSSFTNLDVADDYAGSTLGMRLLQFYVAFNVFLNNPFLGGGFSYVRDLINMPGLEDLYNTESALFSWGLSLGALGLFSYVYLFGRLFFWAKKRILIRRQFYIFSGMFFGYILFILSTGVMETLQFFLLVCVLMIRLGAKDESR